MVQSGEAKASRATCDQLFSWGRLALPESLPPFRSLSHFLTSVGHFRRTFNGKWKPALSCNLDTTSFGHPFFSRIGRISLNLYHSPALCCFDLHQLTYYLKISSGLNARNGSNHLSPPFEGSGEDDADSDIGANPSHPQHRSPGETYLYTHAVPIPSNGAGTTAGAAGTVGGGGGGTNPGGTFVNNTSSAAGLGIGLGGLWGSPGAGSSG